MLCSRPATSWCARLTPSSVLLALVAGLVAVVVVPVAAPAPPAAALSGVRTGVAPTPASCDTTLTIRTCNPVDIHHSITVNGADTSGPLKVGDVVRVTLSVDASTTPYLTETGDYTRDRVSRPGYQERLSIVTPSAAGVLSQPVVTSMSRTDRGNRGSGPAGACAAQSGEDPVHEGSASNVVFGAAPVTPAGIQATLTGRTVTGMFTSLSVDRCAGLLSKNGLYPGQSITIRQRVVAAPVGTTNLTWTLSGLDFGYYSSSSQSYLSWGTGLDLTMPILSRPDHPVLTTLYADTENGGGAVQLGVRADSRSESPTLGWQVTPYLAGSALPAVRIPAGTDVVDGQQYFFRVGGLTNGSSYQFGVAAYNANGVGPQRPWQFEEPVRVFTTPAAPADVHAFSLDDGAGSGVSWTVPDDGGAPISRAYVKVYVNDRFVREDSFPSPGTMVRVGSDVGVRARFEVVLDNGAGQRSGAGTSNEVLVGRPDAPTDVTALGVAGGVDLGWTTPHTGGSSGVTGASITTRTRAGAVVSQRTVAFPTPGRVGDPATARVTGLTDGVEYASTVTLRNSEGFGLTSDPVPFVAGLVPDPPTALSGVPGPYPGSVVFTWTNPTGGSTLTGGQLALEGSDGTSAHLDVDPGASAYTAFLSPEVTYAASLKLCNSIGCGLADSTEVTPYGAPSAVPTPALSTTPRVDRIHVSWNPPDRDGGLAVSQYRVAVSSVIQGRVVRQQDVDGSSRALDVDALGPGPYTVTVQASNALYSGPASEAAGPVTVEVYRPSAPTLTGASAGVESADLQWTPPDDEGGSEVRGYVVESSVGSSTMAGLLTGAESRSMSVADLLPGLAYRFTVKAYNDVGRSDASLTRSVIPTAADGTPGAPPVPTVAAGDGAVTVRWTAPSSSGGSPVFAYRITAFSAGSPPVTSLIPSSNTAPVLGGLTNGTAYTVRVSAVNDQGLGLVSRASVAVRPKPGTTVPVAPTIGTVTAGDGSAVVRWTKSTSNGGSAITGYRVTPYVGGVARPATTFPATAGSGTVPGLANGTAYRFTVAAVNAVGASPESAPSAEVTPRAPVVRPGPPTIGTAEAFNSIGFVRWTAPASDGGSPITGYRVTPYVGGVAKTPTVFDGTATYGSVRGLNNGTTYTFRVRAINAQGAGTASGESNAITPNPAPGTPAAPTIQTATPADGAVVLTWTAPTDTGGQPITGYRVIAFVNGVAQPYLQFSDAQTTRSIAGLTNGTAYRFKVAAVNANGVGADSTLSAAVTPAAP